MSKITLYTGGFFQTNGYLLEGPAGTVLIDAPEGVTGWLESAGKRVDHLLLTHQHYDHVAGSAAVCASFGCPVSAWSAYDPSLTLEEFLPAAIGWPVELDPYEIDDVLEGRDRVEAAGFHFRLMHIPGHSPDSVSFILQEDGEDAGIVFGGDVLFTGGIGRPDFPHGDGNLLVTGILEKLFTLPEDTRVYPGHGPTTTIGEEKRTNPYVGEGRQLG